MPVPISPACQFWLAEATETDDRSTECEEELAFTQLSASERQRWERFRPAEKKRQFLNSRIAVRMVLLKEYGAVAQQLHLTADSNGRPAICDSAGTKVGNISLSHSAGITAVAVFGLTAKLGVDVEAIKPRRKPASRILGVSDREIEKLRSVSGISDHEAMLAAWTMKEAVWKCADHATTITASNIFIEKRPAGWVARILLPQFADEEFSLKLFSSRQTGGLGGPQCQNAEEGSFSVAFVGCIAEGSH